MAKVLVSVRKCSNASVRSPGATFRGWNLHVNLYACPALVSFCFLANKNRFIINIVFTSFSFFNAFSFYRILMKVCVCHALLSCFPTSTNGSSQCFVFGSVVLSRNIEKIRIWSVNASAERPEMQWRTWKRRTPCRRFCPGTSRKPSATLAGRCRTGTLRSTLASPRTFSRCVCVCEREGEKERDRDAQRHTPQRWGGGSEYRACHTIKTCHVEFI